MADDVSARIRRALEGELEQGCALGVFPGASACVGIWAGGAWDYVDVATGQLDAGPDRVQVDTVYDLASLTKPWVATTAIRLHQAGVFDLDAPVSALIAEATGMPIGDHTWEELFSHRSGLEAWVPFYDSLPCAAGTEAARAWVLAELLPHWEQDTVGSPVYSDLGYILGGIALERATEASLGALIKREVSARLGLEDEVFFGAELADQAWKARCAPTGWSDWRGRELRGEVHDDNCAALGGVAGHAGLFGRARAVARFGAAQVGALHGRHGALDEELVQHATLPRPRGTHRLGWDGKAENGSAAGSLIDPNAFGHLGFTGTSIWCDPRRQLVVVLLTNRVAVSDDNTAIRQFRPAFHDAVFRAFDGPG